MGLRGRLAGLAMLLLAMVTVLLTPLSPTPGVPTAFAADETADRLAVLVILDASGSMSRQDGDSGTLLRGAKGAFKELIRALPRSAYVGLRVYGASYSGTNRARSCRDTQLLVPVEPLDQQRLLSQLDPLRPTGDTPIGLALERASGDFDRTADARRVVVLISDGEDNCSPPAAPPCRVAKQLDDSGINIRVETIGVALRGDRAAREALKCIAGSTGGDYYDAADADALSAALNRIASETLGALGRGTAVTGARTLRNAPLIEPGTYRDSIRPGRTRWYRFRVTEDGRPRVLATVQGLDSLRVPESKSVRKCPAWRVELFNPYGEGGTYSPYGNSGQFDGAGYGATGVTSVNPVSVLASGIDYSGTWAVSLSLARDTMDTCSAHLPENAEFSVRFTVETGRQPAQPVDEPSPANQEQTPPPAEGPSGPQPGDETAGPGRSEAAEKYFSPITESAPAWLYPVTAVGGALLVGTATALGLRWRRRRRQGW